ncbi:kinase [Caballeronia hypogeia]|uniref:Kinase n=1 Tax=Caballeronia hypogeia TaxID=1777140 RepID=A0A158DUM1_9BURK|nr:dihydroxyacetone kinase subunit DhaL [Caballeronia hypogeia]SAK98322.1 kinase [Caballeronia hypogeia]
MNGAKVSSLVVAAHAAVERNKDEIASLDQAIGDGDHVFNLLRGFGAVAALVGTIEQLPLHAALKLSSQKVLSTVGGSSGPLFASLLLGMSKSLASDADSEITTDKVADAFAAGVSEMQRWGKTGTGSKTMMDVLIPVMQEFMKLAQSGASARQILVSLPKVATDGCQATKDMVATKGRASFMGERSKGHIDPGARSCEVMIRAVCEQILSDATESKNEEVHE